MTQSSPSEVIQDLIGALIHAHSPHRAYRIIGTAGSVGSRTVSAIVEVIRADGSTHTMRVEVHDADGDRN
jgi:hypothetical protein